MISLRRAQPQDADQLTELARESKAHWGYPQEWLDVWRKDLSFTAGYLRDNHVIVAEAGSQLAGVAALVRHTQYLDIEHFWIRPAYMSRGLGKQLFLAVIAHGRDTGTRELNIVSDPHAQGFYIRMGCTLHEYIDTPIKDRQLPVYRYRLTQDQASANTDSSSA